MTVRPTNKTRGLWRARPSPSPFRFPSRPQILIWCLGKVGLSRRWRQCQYRRRASFLIPMQSLPHFSCKRIHRLLCLRAPDKSLDDDEKCGHAPPSESAGCTANNWVASSNSSGLKDPRTHGSAVVEEFFARRRKQNAILSVT